MPVVVLPVTVTSDGRYSHHACMQIDSVAVPVDTEEVHPDNVAHYAAAYTQLLCCLPS